MIRWDDLVASRAALMYVVIALVAGTMAVLGSTYGLTGTDGRIGPGFLPVVAGGLTAVLCLAAAGSEVRDRRARAAVAAPVAGAGADEESGVDAAGRTEAERVRNLWLVFAMILCALLLVSTVGFLAAFGLLVLTISVVIEHRPVLRALLLAAAMVLLVYLVFGVFLGVPLPGGVLGLGTEV